MVNDGSAPAVPRPDGLVLAPLRALRFDGSVVDPARVLAPPYDVIDADAAAALRARDPHNAVRLTLPDDEDGPGTRYAVAARTMAQWRADRVLRADPEPGVYVYEQHTDGHVVRGLVGALGLTPASDGIVLPHENTMAGPVTDRLALMRATAADLEPIFCVYDGGGAASELVAAADRHPALLDVVDGTGARHRLWSITGREELSQLAADLHGRRAVIADGHHRYATFLRYQQERHDAGDGPGPWDLGLAFLVDGSSFGPQVLAIHRAVPGLAVGRAAELASAGFRVTPVVGDVGAATSASAAAGRGGPAFVLTDGQQSWLLDAPDRAAIDAAMPPDRSPAWRGLDVAVAHSYLIRSLWQLDDDEDTVEFHHDVASAVTSAQARGGTALLLNPTPVAAVAAVAAAGDRMPRKSTLFVPKPATGVVMRAFADG